MGLFRAKKPKFPTISVTVLVLAMIWLLSDLSYLKVTIPWIPVVLIILSVGMIINRYR